MVRTITEEFDPEGRLTKRVTVEKTDEKTVPPTLVVDWVPATPAVDWQHQWQPAGWYQHQSVWTKFL